MSKLRYPIRASALAFICALVYVLAPAPAATKAFAVPVQINSGDPAFPFPQFLPYEHPDGDVLYNLGTHNPAGVTHAEMEKTVRDAYQIMMNRASYHQNIALNGVKYIKYASNPDCSEGTGYAMLGAAMMADKATFDGLWLFTHDFAMNNVVRYRDGSRAPAYSYSTLPGWTNAAGGNSAADGDFDIAIALMIAHKQWGEFMGINDSRGNKISYKADFLQFIKGLSDTLSYSNGNLLSGDIGFDGYIKGGDSWVELTNWAQNAQNLRESFGISKRVETNGPASQHIDYAAPAYFREFADYMQAENAGAYAWNISQFQRAEASSDWLMGKLIGQNPKNIPVAGWVEMRNDTVPAFSTFSDGEDFRAAWRTVLNYVWHGNPRYGWDPLNHAVINRANTFQRDAGSRFAKFLWDRRQAPWNGSCEKPNTGVGEGDWWGPSALKYHYSPQGEVLGDFALNWIQGTGSLSAVTGRDTGLMAEMYRQAELEWDVEEPGDRYLTSTPHYFHGFFRLLGLNVLTGNHHAPMNMKRSANMKVYLDVDKTYAFEDDTITYTIDYRNYGAAEAGGVRIVNRLHGDFVFISGTGSPSYDASANTVTWNIGSVPGFKTSTGINPTKGSVTLKVKIPRAGLKRYENRVEISCANGSGWTSNGYPNKISSVMKRTGVDIARRALRVDHTVYRDTVNPGMTAIYTIDFENSADAGWLNGGRPGVNFSYAHNGTAASAGSHTFMLRAFSDAHEAYIDYGNYRISYFLFDNNYKGLGANGWNYRTDIMYVPEAERSKFKLDHENITPGESAKGKWNQRLILQIADVLDPSRSDTNWGTMAAPTQFLITYSGLDNRVHRGISTPFKGVWAVYAGNYANRNWGGDWSYNSRASGTIANDAMANWGYPITPDFTEAPAGDTIGKPVRRLHRKLCGADASVTVDNVLIEEWDGYTWRRVFGNGPLPGREVNNVVIRDTLPAGVTFLNFIGANPMGVAPVINGRVVTWSIDRLLVGEKGRIQYGVRADTPSVFTNVRITSNAWASADRESPMKSAATLVVTRDSLPPPPPEPTTMYKRANKNAYSPGDTVVYTVAYKQTHGYPAVSNSSGQWDGTDKSVSADGKTISFGNSNVDMRFTPAAGTNVTLTGTMSPQSYSPAFYIFARRTAQGSVELKFERKYIQSENFPGVQVTITSNGRIIDSVGVPVADAETSINYKFVFKNDSLLMWMGDTAAVIPFMVSKGIAVQSGGAGVRYVSTGGGSSSKITGWTSRADLAYDITIRDTVPFGVRYITGSATGSINTGTVAPKQLTGGVSGNVITWPVVSGSGNPLGAGDSLTVTWRGVVDTSKTGFVVNTAYADIGGYPKDAVGAQVRSRFSLVGGPDDPDPPPGDTLAVDTLSGDLTLSVTPPGYPSACMFAGSVMVTLSSRAGAAIWYTTNGTAPDSASFTSRRYTGPLEFIMFTELRAVAYAAGFEPFFTDTHIYEPINTVPIRFAMFYDNVGDGMAHGVKVIVSSNWVSSLNQAVIKAHPELLSLPGLPAIDSLRFAGDTIEIPFRNGAGADPLGPNSKLIITDPPLPDPRYANEHGYLAEGAHNIRDGVVPIITQAVYYVALKDGTLQGGGVAGDTLAVTFNKPPSVHNSGELVPFVLSYTSSGVTCKYELRLTSDTRLEGNTCYFAVVGMAGANPPPGGVPSEGDSIRVKVGVGARGIWQMDTAIVQQHENNPAVALKIRYPSFKYIVNIGPNPSSNTVRIAVSMEPFLPSAFDKLAPKAVLFDRMGGVVAVKDNTAFKLGDEHCERCHILVWDGCNRSGRKVGTGTYRIVLTMTGQEGDRKTIVNNVYIIRRK
ncbi:MAG: DUF11 domain-containing protein [Chitinispirillales bacterium]|jgi:uncharacterized repeat protein (TIGR01451 family)|nr:DUF11 domain-containing protein [Chitinispirillales bacterium]